MQPNLIKKDLNNYSIKKNENAIFLFSGLALWFVIPILGIFPLLGFVHLNRKQNSKLNLIITLIIILTITIFVSSVDIISDLAVYVDTYEKLGKESPFEIAGGRGFEFVLWLCSYPVYLISNGSRYAFIFFWSFVFNCLTLLVITKGFSPRNYGLLALFIVSTPNFLGYQGFLVRQYFATVIFLIAVINADKKVLMWGLYVLSLFTHIGNLLYLPILLLYTKVKLLQSKTAKLLIVFLGLIVPFSTAIIYDIATLIAKILPSQYATVILLKTHRYGRQQVELNDFGIAFIEQFVFFLIVIFLTYNKPIKHPREKIMHFLYPIFLSIMYMGREIFLFSNRFSFILFPFSGVFYYFLTEHKLKVFGKEIITYLLIGKVIYFCYFLNEVNNGNTVQTFMNGRTIESNVFDYIEVVYDGFTDDVKIKELPERTII